MSFVSVLDRIKQWQARRNAQKNSAVVVVIAVDQASKDFTDSAIYQMLYQTVPVKHVFVVLRGGVKKDELSVSAKTLLLHPVSIMEETQGGFDQFHLIFKKYPEDIVISVRNSVYFPDDLVEEMLSAHNRFPHAIICGRAQLVAFDGKNELVKTSIVDKDTSLRMRPTLSLISLESGGILFPPSVSFMFSLDTNKSVHIDDSDSFSVWLYALQNACNVPSVPLNNATVFHPVFLIEQSEPSYVELDLLTNRFDEIKKAFSNFDRSLPTPQTIKYQSEFGNVLLMAGDSSINGATLSLLALAKHLRALGENVFFVLPYSGPIESLIREAWMDYDVLGDGWYQWVTPFSYSDQEELERQNDWIPKAKKTSEAILEFIQNEKIDLIHENTSGSFVAADAAKAANSKLVWHFREFNEEDHQQKLWEKLSPYQRFGEADACICISQAIFNKYKPLVVPPDNLVLIYNGLDPRTYFDSDHTVLSSSETKMVCSGRITPGKGQLVLVKAFVRLAQKYPLLSLYLVGEEHDKDYCQEIQDLIDEHRLSERVFIVGAVDDMAAEWKKADIAVVPSVFEAFGRCTIEAMMAGCVAVGSDSAGTAEIINDGETGLLFKVGDETDLADKVSWVLDNAEAARYMARSGQEDAMQRFTSERNALEVFQLHQNILGNSCS